MATPNYLADSHLATQAQMLQDSVRIRSYQSAMHLNKDLFTGKRVLDVGCGTGILSMFAVKAGAEHVYAIDTSDIIDHVQELVDANGFKDKITVVKGKLEDADLPTTKFDIIISQWMGFCLLYESILDTVLFARDKHLKKDGLIFPDTATMTIAAIEDQDYRNEKIGYWDNVYGLDFSSLKEAALREPVVDFVAMNSLITDSYTVKAINLLTVERAQLPFAATFSLTASRDDFVHGFVVWFDVSFACCTTHPIRFSTGPQVKYTNWKQTTFYTPEALAIAKDQKIIGSLSCVPNEQNKHDLDITISHQIDDGNEVTTRYKMY
ncbi:protein arginine n-methyltransferase [Mycena vulgaris]|nr:protein arginine n-methyltransferase [Mycena vulgaris]